MATAAALPKTIFITLPSSAISPNSAYVQCSNGVLPTNIGVKRPFSAVSASLQSPTSTNLSTNGWLPATVQRTFKYDEDDDDDYDYDDSSDQDPSQYPDSDQPPRKRERLTHLSPEEKLFRRKMKNRIAAQTARDRKKALMFDLEENCRRLEEENDSLSAENTKLRSDQTSLAEENERLKRMLQDKDEQRKAIGTTMCHDRDDARTVSAFGPAEFICVPLPKEQAKTERALAWLLASALIQLLSSCCDSLSTHQVDQLSSQLQQLKESGSLTVEEVLSRSPPEAIQKLASVIRTYKSSMPPKPP